jgi:hypothetical protein
MSKILVLVVAIAAAAAALAGASQASPPVHIRVPLNFTDLSPDYTAACGFPVYLSTNGIVDVTLHTNHDGSVREQDVFPGLTITVSAPSTGESFDHVFGPSTYEYPEGVFIGAPAVITSNGVRGDAPGIPPDAGQVVTPGVVIDIIPDLGPITVPTGPPISQHGHFEDPEAIVEAICTALAG